MIKAAVYCRVSTEKENQANSFQNQQAFFRDYINRQPNHSLFAIYADEGSSGTSVKKRVEFQHMLSDAENGCFQRIFTKEVSRFSRNILDTIRYSRELRALGVTILFLNDGIDTAAPDAELRLSIMAAMAQEESRKTSDRVKWGQTRQMEKGIVFGRSLLGYTLKNGKLEIEPAGAAIVHRIFTAYGIEKKGSSTIARMLTAAGIPTSRGNTQWAPGQIIKILKNEKYVGDLIQKKSYTPDYLDHAKKTNRGQEELIVIRGHHTPIIEHELWDAVQSELSARRKRR